MKGWKMGIYQVASEFFHVREVLGITLPRPEPISESAPGEVVARPDTDVVADGATASQPVPEDSNKRNRAPLKERAANTVGQSAKLRKIHQKELREKEILMEVE